MNFTFYFKSTVNIINVIQFDTRWNGQKKISAATNLQIDYICIDTTVVLPRTWSNIFVLPCICIVCVSIIVYIVDSQRGRYTICVFMYSVQRVSNGSDSVAIGHIAECQSIRKCVNTLDKYMQIIYNAVSRNGSESNRRWRCDAMLWFEYMCRIYKQHTYKHNHSLVLYLKIWLVNFQFVSITLQNWNDTLLMMMIIVVWPSSDWLCIYWIKYTTHTH